MFGYVTICRETLSEEDYNIFRAYYCGLCKEIGKRCSQLSRMALSYDITFLALVLSSVQEGASDMKESRCALHPAGKRQCVLKDKAVSYAADMGTVLSYLKSADDWHDDKSVKALLGMMMLRLGVKRARKRYPETYNKIKSCLDELSDLEKEGCGEIDRTADCFANILKLLFTPDFITDTNTRRALEWFGYNIGRWIYIIDAYADMESDFRSDAYNTFLVDSSGIEEAKNKIRDSIGVSLTFTLENVSSAYNLIKIYKNKNILDNIIYLSLKMKQDNILGEKNESI